MSRRQTYSASDRRADAEARAEAARAPGRRLRSAFFVGALALVCGVLGASLDPHHRLNGFLFGGLAGAAIGIALLAWPTDSDYPQDFIDKTLD